MWWWAMKPRTCVCVCVYVCVVCHFVMVGEGDTILVVMVCSNLPTDGDWRCVW